MQGWMYLCIYFYATAGFSKHFDILSGIVLERTPKYRTSNTSNIKIPNFEHIEHDTQILRPNIKQARLNIEL